MTIAKAPCSTYYWGKLWLSVKGKNAGITKPNFLVPASRGFSSNFTSFPMIIGLPVLEPSQTNTIFFLKMLGNCLVKSVAFVTSKHYELAQPLIWLKPNFENLLCTKFQLSHHTPYNTYSILVNGQHMCILHNRNYPF